MALDKSVSSIEDADDALRFYPIDGDYFVLRYAEAITFNVEYVIVTEPDAPPTGEV